tara:strand:+ start:394 stop:687 length:294 start_codon:yes stop_codon:yes gene_type:complete
MSKDKVFADGFIFKRRQDAPQFVIGNIAVKVEEAVAFLNANQKNGWVNLNVLNSQAGKPYIELDTFVPKKQESQEGQEGSAETKNPATSAPIEDLPF